MFSYKYISESSLPNLNRYTYNSKDRSLFANYVMQPFWNSAAKFLPEWVAPNLVTLIGFFAIVLSYVVTAYYSPTLSEHLPRWVYLLNAVCLFFYQTLDALDGKQARKTKTSSPLGELFDHGCDAMSTVFCVLVTGASIASGPGVILYSNLTIILATFFLSQWDAYYNGILDLWYINVTEAQFFGIGLQLIGFNVGSVDFWHQTFFVGPLEISYGFCVIIPSTLTCIGFALSSMWNVYVHWSNLPEDKKESRKREVIESVLPCLFLSILYSLWGYLSPNLLNHIHAFGLCLGFLFSNLVGKLVMCRVCKLKPFTMHLNLIPLPFAILNSLLGGFFFNEVYFLYFYCALAIISYLHFSLCLVEQMTTFLKIKCLTIPYPPPADPTPVISQTPQIPTTPKKTF